MSDETNTYGDGHKHLWRDQTEMERRTFQEMWQESLGPCEVLGDADYAGNVLSLVCVRCFVGQRYVFSSLTTVGPLPEVLDFS